MVEIKKASKEFNKVEEYLLTISPSIHILNKVEDGTIIPVAGWALYTDSKGPDADPVEILSIITPTGEVYSCQSATFKRCFFDIENIMGDASHAIIKRSGTSKSGRPFIECVLDISSVK